MIQVTGAEDRVACIFEICSIMLMYHYPGIHLEKDMSVPFGHTVATTVCLFEMICARKLVECAFFEILCITISLQQ